jgi:DNA processing protein
VTESGDGAWHPDDLAAWLTLVLAPGLGGMRQRRLMSRFGLPKAILQAPFAAVAAEVGEKAARSFFDFDAGPAVDQTGNWLSRPGCHLLPLGSPFYPNRLLDTADPPSLLWVEGRLEALQLRALAIVGSRTPTRQGLDNARAFARHLAGQNLLIVSGLAGGIDTAAHEGAIEGQGMTVAVMGTGVDVPYPSSNRGLARRIVDHGAVISEFPLGTQAHAGLFPRRNRIIAGLSQAVLVVEAARKSGSLITARLAVEEGRDVLAIPGSIHSPLSRGCHQLIREGARLVECAQDIFDELNGPSTLPAPKNERKPALRATATPGLFTSIEAPPSTIQPLPGLADTACGGGGLPPEPLYAVWVLLSGGPTPMEALVEQSGLTVDALYPILLDLELDGWLQRLPGGHFEQRIPQGSAG